MTMANGSLELLPAAEFEALRAEATKQLSARRRTGSRYQDLAEIARMHQHFGNRLSQAIYRAAAERADKSIACVSGCATCCTIPSSVYESESSTFTMTVLDMITLAEYYAEIKVVDGSLAVKAIERVHEARRSKRAVSCPHLTEAGTCGIYTHRPVACKIWFSSDLGLCVKNRDHGYPIGLNSMTDASNLMRRELEKPFEECVNEIAPDLDFGGHDFLLAFEEIAKLTHHNLIDMLKAKIDACEQQDWNPFDSPKD